MEKEIIEYIGRHKKSYIDTYTMRLHFQSNKNFDYATFAISIENLVNKGLINPVMSSGKDHRIDFPLYKRYKSIPQKKIVSNEYKKEIQHSYHPKMKVSFYINNPEQYEKDRPILKAINLFLNIRGEDWLTVNERSFELFRDEKWLANEGVTLLKKVGLSLDDLQCEPVYEPFFYFAVPSWYFSSYSYILIVENKDTYGTFKKMFKKGLNTFNKISFDLLIYGEGEKIIRSIEFIWELVGTASKEVKGYYFGDIDPIGIEICISLMNKNEIPIIPMISFYEAMLIKYNGLRLQRKKDKHKYKPAVATEFSQYISEPLREELFDILKDFYIPQEGLNRTMLEAMSRKD